ncbi:MAG: tetratricopeptide repeat protein [Elusimicrobiota bacterium]
MRRAVAIALLVLAATSCSRREELNYKHCLKLRVGMSKDDMLKVMGAPEETLPYVEGKSLAYLKGRTAYEWSNPATMPGGDHVSMDEASGKIESVRCSNSEITASVVSEPPVPSRAAAVAPPAAPAPAAAVPKAPAAGLADAVAFYRKKDFVSAMRIAGSLAQNGDPDAQLLTGVIFVNGAAPGREAEGRSAAQMWFYKSARQNNAEAQALYAASIMDNGTPPQTVVNEIKLAADLKSPAGERLQADVYLKGLYSDIVPKDEREGEKWLELAAQGGDPTAQLALGRRFQSGKNPVEAYRWALAASSHPLVDKFRDPLHSLTSAWTPEQQADAKKLIQDLRPRLTPAQLKDAENAP